jgi:hypothetical protein
MAARPPVYAKCTITHTRFREFQSLLQKAGHEALFEAGEIGRAEARSRYTRKYATGPGSTKASINFRFAGEKILMIYVGTLRGVFKEYGTKVREKRGQQEAQPFLRPGAKAAFASLLPGIRKRAPGRTRL